MYFRRLSSNDTEHYTVSLNLGYILYLCALNIRRRQWHPTPVLLPRKSHGRRSLVGSSPWGRTESDTTKRLHFHFWLSGIGEGNGNPLQCSCLENPRDGEPGGLPSMGSHRVGHDWSDSAAAAALNITPSDGCLHLCFSHFPLHSWSCSFGKKLFFGKEIFWYYFTWDFHSAAFQAALAKSQCFYQQETVRLLPM